MKVYRQLFIFYHSQNETEASMASWAMAEAWAKTLGLNLQDFLSKNEQVFVGKIREMLESDLIKSTHTDAEQEVILLREQWRSTPLSAVLMTADQESAY